MLHSLGSSSWELQRADAVMASKFPSCCTYSRITSSLSSSDPLYFVSNSRMSCTVIWERNGKRPGYNDALSKLLVELVKKKKKKDLWSHIFVKSLGYGQAQTWFNLVFKSGIKCFSHFRWDAGCHTAEQCFPVWFNLTKKIKQCFYNLGFQLLNWTGEMMMQQTRRILNLNFIYLKNSEHYKYSLWYRLRPPLFGSKSLSKMHIDERLFYSHQYIP